MFPLKNIETLGAESEQPASKARKPFKRKRQLSKREPDEDPVGEKPKSKKSQGINEMHKLPTVRNYPRQNPSTVSGAEGVVAVKKKPKHKTNQSVCVDEASSFASSRGKGKQKKPGNPNLTGANSFDATTEKSKQKKKGLSLTEGGSIAVTEKPKQKNRNLNGTSDIIVEKVKVENRKFQNQRKNEVMTRLPGKEKPKMKKQQFQSTEGASGSVAGNTVKPKAASQPVFVSKKKKPVKGQIQTKVITKEENLGQKLKKKKKKAQTVNVIGWQQLEKDLESCISFNGDIEGASALPECSYQSKDSLMLSGCDSEKDVIGKKLSKKMKSLQLSTSVDKQSENASKKLSKVKKGGGNAKKKKTNIAKEKPYVIETETFDNQRLISNPKELFKIGKDAYIVVLLPGQSLYVHGLVSVQVLVGRVMVLGYRMDELEKQNIFSFNSHALLSINATEGHRLNASRHSYLLDYGLSRQQLEEAAKTEVEPLVIFELRKTVLPIAKQLAIIGNQQVMVPKDREGHKTLYGLIVTEENCHKYALMEESAEWRELMENVQLYFECGIAPRLVLCGGKGVGKSTLFKYVVNRLLSKKGTVVQCLDTDPGQSELSLPSCLSLTQVREPLLGPAYTHHANPSSANVKQIMVGVVSPQFGLQRYIKAVKDLLELSRKHPDRPLVVNTMGWTVGTGLDLMLDLIRIMSPSHVIQIQRNYAESNFAVQLSDYNVQNYLGGICTKSNNCELHYNLTEVKALSGRKVAGAFTPKLFRELAVMLQLSDILIDFTENPSDQEDGSHTLIIPWPEIVLHVCGSKIPKARILQVLNGNLVALCQVDPKKVEFIAPDLPKQLTDDLDFGQCWGWGVVRGIDPLTKSLHILTSVQSEIIGTKINAIVKPEMYIPDRFYNFFTKGEGPYFQKMHRSGAGRLKVSRQIKPKMPKFGPKKDN
ncbi:polynucleotide 5'-hydroxyl-kinase NOL9-like [Macrobrachium nipponense]|uniref:polynucleotide 5'-hydroxyl-kinase NOL9-like n=1 Tax=Macrobrachium nipponense TaxID=159736 RepID=UPI0030C897E6